MATNGIDLPVLNVFRMFNRMQGQRVTATSTAALNLDDILSASVRSQPDVSAFASRDGNKLYVLIWYYHDDDVAGPDAQVRIDSSHLRSKCAVLVESRVDQDHSNAFTAWQRLGSPMILNEAQYASIETAGKLTAVGVAVEVPIHSGHVSYTLTLPRQGVSLLEFEMKNAPCSH